MPRALIGRRLGPDGCVCNQGDLARQFYSIVLSIIRRSHTHKKTTRSVRIYYIHTRTFQISSVVWTEKTLDTSPTNGTSSIPLVRPAN